MSEFLLEIGVEELPALEIYDIAEQFKELFELFFKEKRINYSDLRVFFTPRRIAVYIKGLADFQDTWEVEVTGPPAKVAFDENGNPTKALLGFLSSKNIKLEDIFVEESPKGRYVKARVKEGGKPSKELLAEFLSGLLDKVRLQKSMRWDGSVRFLRPIRWIVCVFDEEVLPVEIAGIKASNVTYGHRLKGNKRLVINRPYYYIDLLKENFVFVDQEERKRELYSKMVKLCQDRGYSLQEDEELLKEVVNLVEYPGVLMGSFPTRYLDLPEPVIITAMKQHQRYFAVRGSDGKLVNYFVTCVNNTEDLKDEIIPNHEKVLRARLEDAEFYMHEDLKIPMEERIEFLKDVVFKENLGSVYDKVLRVQGILDELCKYFEGKIDKNALEVATRLYKVDLTTLMIKDGKEFTKLEGLIGMEYALRQGKDPKIARIIYDHILPRFPGDELPQTLEGALLSIADKLDNLVAFVKSGAELSSSQDPFGLRRIIYAVFEVIKSKALRFNFVSVLRKSAEAFGLSDEKFEEILGWVWERLERYLEEKEGIRYDIVDCVIFANKGDVWDVIRRARVLNDYYTANPKEFEEVVVGQKRANNILTGFSGSPVIYEELFEKEEERKLFEALQNVEPEVKKAVDEEKYEVALEFLRKLKPYIDAFFDKVFVMVEDEKVRNNRLSLLFKVREVFRLYGDFSKIVISQK